MKIHTSNLEKIAATVDQYPPGNLPEIAFAGRSNVGKSSFINSILNRKNLARTSSKPGKTRTVNFYNVNGVFRFVDLPGYGYASVSKAEKEKWTRIIETYLHHRENLMEVILLVDVRHEPTVQDVQMYEWILQIGFTGFVIATKMDKLSKSRAMRQLKVVQKKLHIEDEDLIFLYSSETKYNKDILLEQFGNIVDFGIEQIKENNPIGE